MIKVYSGGKKSKDWILLGQNEYLKRLRKPFDTQFLYFDDEKIANLDQKWPFKSSDYVILLDERGGEFSSVQLANKLEILFANGKNVIFIIGGAYGVSPAVRNKANLVLSISKLIFPHELMRVIMSEQIYRMQDISRGGKYHHQ